MFDDEHKIELKNGIKLYHVKRFPFPCICKDILKKVLSDINESHDDFEYNVQVKPSDFFYSQTRGGDKTYDILITPSELKGIIKFTKSEASFRLQNEMLHRMKDRHFRDKLGQCILKWVLPGSNVDGMNDDDSASTYSIGSFGHSLVSIYRDRDQDAIEEGGGNMLLIAVCVCAVCGGDKYQNQM